MISMTIREAMEHYHQHTPFPAEVGDLRLDNREATLETIAQEDQRISYWAHNHLCTIVIGWTPGVRAVDLEAADAAV